MNATVYGKILRDVYISGTPVLKDTVIEVDEATFRDLRRNEQIEKCAAPEGEKAESKKEPMLAFRVVSKPKKQPSA